MSWHSKEGFSEACVTFCTPGKKKNSGNNWVNYKMIITIILVSVDKQRIYH